MMLKHNVIDPVIVSQQNLQAGFAESADSTPKKLIYQIPFTEVTKLQEIFSQLENKILD